MHGINSKDSIATALFNYRIEAKSLVSSTEPQRNLGGWTSCYMAVSLTETVEVAITLHRASVQGKLLPLLVSFARSAVVCPNQILNVTST